MPEPADGSILYPMDVPLELTFRNVDKTEALESLVRQKAAKLERVCGHLLSCRVAVEKAQHQRAGHPYRVRIDMTVPPGHELVVTRNPGEGRPQDELPTIIRSAFDAARRRLQKLADQQRGETKVHVIPPPLGWEP